MASVDTLSWVVVSVLGGTVFTLIGLLWTTLFHWRTELREDIRASEERLRAEMREMREEFRADMRELREEMRVLRDEVRALGERVASAGA